MFSIAPNGWIICIEGPDISCWTEILEPVFGVNVVHQIVNGSTTNNGNHNNNPNTGNLKDDIRTTTARHDIRTRKLHSISSIAIIETQQSIFVGTKSGYLIRCDVRRKEKKAFVDVVIVKKVCLYGEEQR